MSNPLEGFSRPQKPKFIFSPTTWFTISAFFFIVTVGLVYIQQRAKNQTAPPVAAPGQQLAPLRNTFSGQTTDLIDRYNKVMSDIDGKLLLPSVEKFQPVGKNDLFHAVGYRVSPEINISFEVDNASGKPFSIGFIGQAGSAQKISNLLAVMAAVGATAFGKGEDAGAIARVCAAAADVREKNSIVRVQDLDVFCGVAEGVWIAGVSVPKILPASRKY